MMKINVVLMALIASIGISKVSASVSPALKEEQMVVCFSPKSESSLTQDEFNKVYPLLASYTSEKREAGLIKSAYFMGNIMDGAVFIVLGKDADEARLNGRKISSDLIGIFKDKNIKKGHCTLVAKML